MKKLRIVLAILLLSPLAGLAAQESASYSILSFDIGYAPLYDLGATSNAFKIPSAFGFNIRIADPLSVGFFTYQSGTNVNINLLKMKYDLLPHARALISFGADGTSASPTAIGLGIEAIPFQRKTGGLATDFKLGFDYLWKPSENIGKGKLVFTLSVGVGF